MCNMTLQHFRFIADTIKEIGDAGYRADIATHFADRLGRTNSGFKPERFLKACGV